MASEDWRVLILGEALEIGTLMRGDQTEFWVGLNRFTSKTPSFLTAFYDRLVDKHGRFVGIRFFTADPTAERILKRIPPRAYITTYENPAYFDVFFVSAEPTSCESTGEQAFGGQVFVDDRGVIAISIDFVYLATSSADLEALSSANVLNAPIGPRAGD